MFEPEACVADWERTGLVPVPAEFLAPPDLTERVAAGPPPVDEITDGELLARSEHGDRGGDGEATADGDRAPHAREGGADAPEWAGLAPGVVLASVLTAVDLSGLDEFDLVEAVAGWERLAGWVAAEQVQAVAELAERPLFGRLSSFRDGIDPVSAVGMEISARLRVSHREADSRVVFAQDLVGQRRATLAALRSGTVDVRRARTLVEGVRVLDDERAAAMEARLLPDAAEQTPAGFRKRVERAVAAADPAGFEDRHARAVTDRGRVRFSV